MATETARPKNIHPVGRGTERPADRLICWITDSIPKKNHGLKSVQEMPRKHHSNIMVMHIQHILQTPA